MMPNGEIASLISILDQIAYHQTNGTTGFLRKNKLVSVEITTSSYMMESESIGLIDVCTKKCPLSALFRKNCAPIISNTVNVMIN
ncbi:hypothetical protein BLOT_007033 [Blomia tropicalis]|nr:hypothetical protein BLOT_007033 [Blomia tropicalis]